MLTTLCRSGREIGCTVGANPRYVDQEFRDGNEWLYDVYWVKYDQDGWIRSMPLAAESEWGGRDQADYDFQKLLIVKATVRVMIYEGRTRDGGTEGFANRFAYHVERFHGEPGDTYLLIGFDPQEAGWRFRFDEIVASEAGQAPTRSQR